MTVDPTLVSSFTATVDWLYAGLVRNAHSNTLFDPARGLGGKLLYAGELESGGYPLIVAANIAGAASLTSTHDIDTQKQAIRDGVIDILVTTLSEALRILKNEIRKQDTVAVCVAQEPESLEREMLELGVLPDLLPPGVLDAPKYEPFLSLGARQVDPISADGGHAVMTWSAGGTGGRWLPRLDDIARTCLASSPSSEFLPALRWLRLAPRYLGRLAEGTHLLRCERETALEILLGFRELVAQEEIDVPIDVRLSSGGHSQLHHIVPHGAGNAQEEVSLAGRRQSQSGSRVP